MRTLPFDGALNGRRSAEVDRALRRREERVLEQFAGRVELLAQRVELLLLERYEAGHRRRALPLHFLRGYRHLHLSARQTRPRVPTKHSLQTTGHLVININCDNNNKYIQKLNFWKNYAPPRCQQRYLRNSFGLQIIFEDTGPNAYAN